MQVVGIDGCKFGWIAVQIELNGSFSISKHAHFSEIFEVYPSANRYLVDMVIGLGDKNIARNVENLARERLKPHRTSSVFTPPCRNAVYAKNYEKAKRINLKELNKSISIQSWNIVPKIKEVDSFLLENKSLQRKVWEAHPEICFAALNQGQPMTLKKSIPQGEEERITILQKKYKKAREIYEEGIQIFFRKNVKKDDLLDAICLAVNAMLGEQEEYDFIFSNKNKKDREGVEIKMCCWKNHSS